MLTFLSAKASGRKSASVYRLLCVEDFSVSKPLCVQASPCQGFCAFSVKTLLCVKASVCKSFLVLKFLCVKAFCVKTSLCKDFYM